MQKSTDQSDNRLARSCRVVLILAIALAAYGLVAAGMRFQGVVIVLLGVASWRKLRRRFASTDHGSARMASLAEVEKAGLLSDEADAVLLGRCLPVTPSLASAAAGLLSPDIRSDAAVRRFLAVAYRRRRNEELIRLRNFVHLATFSPAGGGKGVAVMIPNLLANPTNSVIADTKGELYRATAQHRRDAFGKRIFRLDPFEVCGPGGDTLNSFEYIDHDDEKFIDHLRAFANPLIIRGNDEKQPHFNDMAENMLVALSALVCGCQPDRQRRHLGTVRHLASSRDVYTQALDMMLKTDACHGVIKRAAGDLTFPAAEEQGSIFSTFARQTAYLNSPLVARNVASSSFDPMELKTGNADLYLILPHDMLVSHSRLMRLWINTVMSRVTRGEPDESRKVLWYLDEAAHFCKGMQAVEDAVTLYRGYGMRMWFIFQSLGQLKTTFGDKAATILDNIATQQYFGINSYETAEEISKRIGTMTIGTVSANRSTSSSRPTGHKSGDQGGNISTSSGVTHNEIGRRLLMPEEILTLPDDLTLIFHKNLPVLPAKLVRYFEAPEFKDGGTAARKPLGRSAALLAGVTLLIGLAIAAIGVDVASMPPLALPAGRMAAYRPGGQLRPVPLGRRQPRPRPRRRGPSGFLIRIQ